ncbi:hypothetical protein Prum_003900 [Phytohabitans rumicis]|uniref:Uncharacterized protein n=1 Tax=Phytohabitans rumicis TaxID=1076125 RepID=A0A6V8KVK0_9ACTN|nr:hypothetical protein Prum_003900 [Phytohabitans rumicis]
MYLSTAEPPAAGPGPLRLTRTVAREFSGGSPYEGDPLLEEYLTDMTGLYGLRFRPDRYAAGPRVPFTTMADQLLTDLDPLGGPLDLVAIAHASPDADPRRVTACYLCDVAPGSRSPSPSPTRDWPRRSPPCACWARTPAASPTAGHC